MPPLALLLSAAALAGPIDDLAWLSGSWRGEHDGLVMEETWSLPEAGAMMGMFRLVSEGQPAMYELMVIEPDGEGAVMRLKHFDPGLVGWERRRQVLAFRLGRPGDGTSARFVTESGEESLFYRLDGTRLTIDLHTPHGEETFAFERLEPAALPAAQHAPERPPPPLPGPRTVGSTEEPQADPAP